MLARLREVQPAYAPPDQRMLMSLAKLNVRPCGIQVTNIMSGHQNATQAA